MNTDERHQSLARLAATTPARDWLRGRITGRLDWRATIARADLPTPISDLVSRVVRRSRLWRLEKADLAAELCAHFADGLETGKTAERLMQDFGHPKHAAKLIRRAKKRGRHWTYRAFIHTCQGLGTVLLALALAYGLLAWRFFTDKPDIKRNYAAEYNKTIEGIPEDQRAWPLYLETYTMLDPLPKDLANSWPSPAPQNPVYPEALEYLHSQQDVLDLTYTLAAKARMGAPFSDQPDPRIVEADNARNPDAPTQTATPSENPMLIGVLLPTLGHMRSLARLLTFDAHVGAGAGDGARVDKDIRATLAIARHAGDQPVIIGELVDFAIYNLGAQTAGQIINRYPDLLSDDQMRDLAHLFASSQVGDVTYGLKGERWMFQDVVQRTYSDDGNGNGHLTAEGIAMFTQLGNSIQDPAIGPQLVGPIASAVVADRATLTAKYDDFMNQMEARAAEPMWEYDNLPSVSQEVDQLAANPLEKARFLPIVLLMPALDRAVDTGQGVIQRRDALLAGIALELYRRDHAQYPDSLEALTPKYLPSVPLDRFTGKPLHYALKNGQPTLWSVGADRDDDGGRPPESDTGDITRWRPAQEAARLESSDPKRYDGDWVLWPVVYEPITGENDDD